MDTATLPKLQSLPGKPRPNATLFLCRWMIEQAFRSVCDANGSPSEVAQEAYDWLTCDLDWTHYGIVPPEDLRQEYVLSFQWCCQWLNLNPDTVRRHGLPLGVVLVGTNSRKHVHSRPSNPHGRNSRTHIFGLPDVRAHWRRAAQQAKPVLARSHEQHEELYASL